MKSSGRNLSLTSYDDLFAMDESRADADREKVLEIPLTELFPFRDHPFKVRDDDKMADTAESIREYGVLVPVLARPRDGGGYELISGTGESAAANWQDWKPCPSSSATWMMMPP